MTRLLTTVTCLLVAMSLVAFAGEGRIPLWQQTPILQSGAYVVTRNFSGQVSDPALFTIGPSDQVDELEIDLNGFTLGTNEGASAVIAVSGLRRVVIRNGSLRPSTATPTDGIQVSDCEVVVLEDLDILGSAVGIHLVNVDSATIRRTNVKGTTSEGILVDNSAAAFRRIRPESCGK